MVTLLGAGQLGVEQVAASDEVGFDVDCELGEATVALDFAELPSATSMPAAVQRLRMSP